MIWTYTILSTYRNVCAHQTYRKYLLRDIPYRETPQMKWGNEVHSALEHRVQGGKPLPPNMHTFEPFAAAFDGKNAKTESQLAIQQSGQPTGYMAKDVWGRGKADVVLVNGTDAYLADWKTGKIREDPFELEIQALLLKAKYPQLTRIAGQYIWLKDLAVGKLHDLSDFQTTWETVHHIVRLIEADLATGEFDKEPGPLCNPWCEVHDCEFKKAVA